MTSVNDALDDLEAELKRQDAKVKQLLSLPKDNVGEQKCEIQLQTGEIPAIERIDAPRDRISNLEAQNAALREMGAANKKEVFQLKLMLKQMHDEVQRLEGELVVKRDEIPQENVDVDMCKVMMMIKKIERKQSQRAKLEHEQAFGDLTRIVSNTCSPTVSDHMMFPSI